MIGSMSRPLVVLLVALLTFPALADSLYFTIDANPTAYGDPGLVVTYRVLVRNTEEPPARDVTVTIPLPPGQLLQVAPQHPDWKCTSSPSQVVCTRALLPVTDFRTDQPILITVKLSEDRRGMSFNEPATATSASQTVTYAVVAVTNALFSVTSSADAGPGTLRAILEETNEHCRGRVPCKVLFELPPYTTIEPLTPLPVIRGCQVVFLGRQVQTGDRRLELSGAKVTSGSGLEVSSECNGSIDIEDLAINRFPDFAVLLRDRPIGVRLRGVFLGTDITGRELRPNTRGLGVFFTRGGFVHVTDSIISGNRRSGVFAWSGNVSIERSQLEHNGASGAFLAFGQLFVSASTIAHNGEFGLAVAPTITNVSVTGGSVYSNGITGIDWGLDGPGSADRRVPPPPSIRDASFDAEKNATVITGTFARESVIGPLLGLQVWASRALNASGHAEGERALAAQVTIAQEADGSFSYRAEVREDLRGQIVTVTVGSSPYLDAVPAYTTEFSAGVTVR